MWEWIVVLGACFVQVSEIYTYSSLVIRFFYHDYVGQPFKVVDFSDEIRF